MALRRWKRTAPGQYERWSPLTRPQKRNHSMADTSSIQWTNATWNPTTGCTKVSPGCAHCYIERTPPFRMEGRHFEKGHIPLRLHEDRLDQPLHWRKPRRVFVNSLSDLFHDDIPDEFIDRVFAVMTLTPWHTFQVLTKRPGRMLYYLTEKYQRPESHKIESAKGKPAWDTRQDFVNLAIDHVMIGNKLFDRDDWWTSEGSLKNRFRDWPLSNVWLGVSVEDQQRADERIPLLLRTPAAVRFLSVEPLLSPLDLTEWISLDMRQAANRHWDRTGHTSAVDGQFIPPDSLRCTDCAWQRSRDLRVIDWVILGGESGPGARPCVAEWLRSLVAQCQAAQVPVFVKQLGSVSVYSDPGTTWPAGLTHEPHSLGLRVLLRDRKGGDPADWPANLNVREFPA